MHLRGPGILDIQRQPLGLGFLFELIQLHLNHILVQTQFGQRCLGFRRFRTLCKSSDILVDVFQLCRDLLPVEGVIRASADDDLSPDSCLGTDHLGGNPLGTLDGSGNDGSETGAGCDRAIAVDMTVHNAVGLYRFPA